MQPSEDKPNATALLDLEVEEIAFVDKGAGLNPRIMITKRRPASDAARQEVRKAMTLEEVMASLSDEQKAIIMAAIEHAKMMAGEESKPKVEVEMADKADMEFEGQAEKGEMAKPLVNGKEPEEYMKRLETIEKAREADRVALAKAKAEIEVLKHREKIAKYKLEAEQEFAAVPGASTEQVAKLLVACDGAPEGSDLRSLRGVLKAAHEAVRASELLKQHGAAGRGPSTSRAAWDAKVEEIAKRDAVNKSKAIVIAMREAPELYTAAREEV